MTIPFCLSVPITLDLSTEPRKVPYPPGATPGEYGGEVLYHTEQVDKGALKSLTELYNRARYGEIGDAKDAEDAEEAFSRLRRL